MGLGDVDLGEQEPVATPASQAPDMTSVESQISMLQQMLPKIKDAGQRAGLVKHFAPKIEDAMAQVEKEIQDKKQKKKHKTNFVQKSIKKAEHIHNDEKILKTNIVEESVNFATKIKELESKISVIEA